MLFGDLSQFYERLGMKRKAIGYSDSAMSASRRLGGMLMPDLWRFRTQIFANSSRPAKHSPVSTALTVRSAATARPKIRPSCSP